jgi:hypothetical protein
VKGPNPGDLVEIQWTPTQTKRAIYVRHTKTGTPIVRVEKVDTKLRPLGKFGADRDMAGLEIVRVLKKKFIAIGGGK